MKRYEKYNPSGIDWIGEIPEHWKLERTKWVFNESKSRNRELKFIDEDLLSVSEYYGVAKRTEKIDNNDILNRAKSLSEYKIVSAGELVINIMLAWKKGLGISDYNGIVSPSYCVFNLTNNNGNPRFFHYLYRTDLYSEIFRQNSRGIIDSRLRLYPEEFFNILTILPSPEEQTAIANYLDEKTVRIDQLIANKQKMIELLKEKHTAIINQAVTKGIDSNVKLKPSGIEWLGDIPEHWEVKKLKYVGKIINGAAFSSSDFLKEGNVRAIKITNIQHDKLIWEDSEFLPDEFTEAYANFRIYFGDIVFALTRPIISSGIKSARVDVKNEIMLLNQRNAVFRVNEAQYPDFLYYITHSRYFYQLFEVNMDTTGQQPNISPLDISNFSIALTNKNEQKAIAKFIEKKTEEIRSTIKKVEKEIELLQEYRTALISEVVTGKIKVI